MSPQNGGFIRAKWTRPRIFCYKNNVRNIQNGGFIRAKSGPLIRHQARILYLLILWVWGTREYPMMHHQNVQSIAIKIFHAEFPWIPKKIHCFRRLSLWVKNSEAYSEVRSNCLIGQKIFLYVVFSIHIWSWITHFQKTLPYLTWCWDNVFVSTIIMIIKEDNCLRQITISIEI